MMAFVDDKAWILNFIRTQFIISDETGICEAVMGQECALEEPESPFPGAHLNQPTKKQRALSPDIFLNMDAKSRRRTNTAAKLDKVRKEREEKSLVRITRWNNTSSASSGSRSRSHSDGLELNADSKGREIFEITEVVPGSRSSQASALSQKLLDGESKFEKENPFHEFGRFDARTSRAESSRLLKVHVYLSGTSQTGIGKEVTMTVCVVPNARVRDVIGVVCWQYSTEGHLPTLLDSADYYSLFLAEDSGEIDTDLPAMDLNESIARFAGVDHVALVQNDTPIHRTVNVPLLVKVSLVEGSFSKVVVDNSEVLLREILEKVLRKRNMPLSVRGLEYTLEKHDEPGVPVDLDRTLGSVRCMDYYLVRGNSKNPALSVNSGDLSSHSKS